MSEVVHKRVETSDGFVIPCDRGERLADFRWSDDWAEVTCGACVLTSPRRSAVMSEAERTNSGCCTACRGTGNASDGPCSDCYATGCAHPPPLCSDKPHSDECQVHVVSALHDRLVRAEETLLQERDESKRRGWFVRAQHLESKADGIRLALSYCREEMRT